MLNKRFESLKDSIVLICLGIASYDDVPYKVCQEKMATLA